MQGMEKTAKTEANFVRPRDKGQQKQHARAALWWRKAGIWTATAILALSLNFASGTQTQNKDAGAFFRPKATCAQKVGEFFKPMAAYAQEEIAKGTLEGWLREGGVRQNSCGYVLRSAAEPGLPEELRQGILELERRGMKPYICSTYAGYLGETVYGFTLSADSTLLVRYGSANYELDLKPYLPADRQMDTDTMSMLSENARFVPVKVVEGELPQIWIADTGMSSLLVIRPFVQDGEMKALPLTMPLNFTISEDFGIYAVTASNNPEFSVVTLYDAGARSGLIVALDSHHLRGEDEGAVWKLPFGPSGDLQPRPSDIKFAPVSRGDERGVVVQDLDSINYLKCERGQEGEVGLPLMTLVAQYLR